MLNRLKLGLLIGAFLSPFYIIQQCKAQELVQDYKSMSLTKHAAWKSGDTVMILSHIITKVDCPGYGHTNLAWREKSIVMQEVKKMMTDEMWPESEQKEAIAMVNKMEGGELSVYIARTDIDWANPKNFTVIVKQGNIEKLRKTLNSRVPNTPNHGDYWWSINTTSIPVKLKLPFDVFIIDSMSDLPRCHFRILK